MPDPSHSNSSSLARGNFAHRSIATQHALKFLGLPLLSAAVTFVLLNVAASVVSDLSRSMQGESVAVPWPVCIVSQADVSPTNGDGARLCNPACSAIQQTSPFQTDQESQQMNATSQGYLRGDVHVVGFRRQPNHNDHQCGAGSSFAPSATFAAKPTALVSEPDGSCSAPFVASCLRVRLPRMIDVFSHEDTKARRIADS
jgi:hypothetical protein